MEDPIFPSSSFLGHRTGLNRTMSGKVGPAWAHKRGEIRVKAVLVIAILLALIAGVAANGSRSRALAATSVPFEQCATRSDACRPILTPLLAQTEAELAAIDGSAEGVGATAGAAEIGESRTVSTMAVGMPTFGRELLNFFLTLIHRSGGSVPPGRIVVAETVFDPVR